MAVQETALAESVSYRWPNCKHNAPLEKAVMILGVDKASFTEQCVFWSLKPKKRWALTEKGTDTVEKKKLF